MGWGSGVPDGVGCGRGLASSDFSMNVANRAFAFSISPVLSYSSFSASNFFNSTNH